MSRRLGIYLDTQNLWHSAVKYGERHGIDRARLQYAVLMDLIAKHGDVSVAKAFVVEHPKFDAKPFVVALEVLGVETFVKKMRQYKERVARADWDVGITVHVLTGLAMDRWDTLVLASGDSDFLPLIEAVKERGKDVFICSFDDALGAEMKSAATGVITLGRSVLFQTDPRQSVSQ